MDGHHLREVQRIPTSGARAAEVVTVGGLALLAVPQLAYDIPGAPAAMNGGDSDTDLLLWCRDGRGYKAWGRIAAPGGEDAEFFSIGDRAFLAVASIRSGSGPYRYDVDSQLLCWDGSTFAPFQVFPGYAAKQWRHLSIAGRHFLALAQGVALPGREADNQPSRIFHWDGTGFVPFQDIDSLWAYNFHHLQIDGAHYLAHADHVTASLLYRWDGTSFVPHQELAPRGCRAFASFAAAGVTYLVVACMQDPSRVLRWDGDRFIEHQELDGLGARELAVVRGQRGPYVVRVNFIHGTPSDPTTALTSQIYQWSDAKLRVIEEFPTTGGTDVAVVADDGGTLLVVTNSLTTDVRFAAETVVYDFIE